MADRKHGIRKQNKPNNKLNELKNDLLSIKGQLVFITKTDDKEAASKIAEELQKQFKSLLSEKDEQIELIEHLQQENQCLRANQAYGDNLTEVSGTHRKLCEIIENRNKSCDALQAKCEQLQKEKKSCETQCEALARQLADLRSFSERPGLKDFVICELGNTVELLEKQLADLSRRSVEDRNKLEERYVAILTRYELMLHLLLSDKQEGEKENNLEPFVEEVKQLLRESQTKSLEEQKELIRESFQLYVLGPAAAKAQTEKAEVIKV